MSNPEYEICPNCGAEVRRGKLACPECGSDAETGWKDSEEIDYQSVEIPDYLGDEFDSKPTRWTGVLMTLGAILALCGMALFVLLR